MSSTPDPDPRPAAAGGAPSEAQMRMARRLAGQHGIPAGTDAEILAALRERGIDPFAPAKMLQVVAVPAEPGVPGPVRDRPAPPPPSPVERAAEIVRIQRDIERRRRRRLARLVTRLAFLVGLPTLLTGLYFYAIATPLFATHSEFVIQQADAPAAGAGVGGLATGGGAAGSTQQDSIAVQAYLTSRDALARLEGDIGFARHFAAPGVDPMLRLDADGTREQAYRLYERLVRIGFDPTEGVVRMDVLAPTPALSEGFSRALIGYAEEQVDRLTARLRGDRMAGAETGFAEAEARMLDAQTRIVDLQEQVGVVSAEAEVSNSYVQIGAIEAELRAARADLDALLANARPQAARVEVARQAVARLEAERARLRASLTDAGASEGSLARVTAELQVAQQDLSTRQAMLQQAAQQLETARTEASRQVRYLSTPVPPTPPDEATHPRALENTVLAFLIFAGAYLMVSLTAAILREQA